MARLRRGAASTCAFSRDQLYKLTAARAIPFRKKRDGQGLLFHRGELDRWLEAAYEPTGCSAGGGAMVVTTERPVNAPAAQIRPGAGNGGTSSDASEG